MHSIVYKTKLTCVPVDSSAWIYLACGFLSTTLWYLLVQTVLHWENLVQSNLRSVHLFASQLHEIKSGKIPSPLFVPLGGVNLHYFGKSQQTTKNTVAPLLLVLRSRQDYSNVKACGRFRPVPSVGFRSACLYRAAMRHRTTHILYLVVTSGNVT